MAALNDQVVKLLSVTDGRDKTYKFLQGATKALAFYTADAADPSLSKKMDKLSKSIGEGRSIMRFAKWTTNIQKLQAIAAKGAAEGWNRFLYIEALRVLGDMGYVVGDNITYFSKYKLLSADPKMCTKWGKNSQFWGFFFQIILDVVKILSLNPAKSTYEADRKSAYLNITKNLADILVILNVVGYLPKEFYNPNAGIQGCLLALSAGIATYQNWVKAAPSDSKKNN